MRTATRRQGPIVRRSAPLVPLWVALLFAGCGSSSPPASTQTVSTQPRLSKPASPPRLPHSGPPVSPVHAFGVHLVHHRRAASVSYELSSPARLLLSIKNVPHGAAGELPVGINETSLSDAPIMPRGKGQSTVHFQQGEFNFSDRQTLHFALKAVVPGSRGAVRFNAPPVYVAPGQSVGSPLRGGRALN
jgi:hypothetical protein